MYNNLYIVCGKTEKGKRKKAKKGDNKLFNFLSNKKVLVLLFIDAIIVMLSYLSTFYFIGSFDIAHYITNTSVAALVYIVILFIYGIYNHIIRYSSVREYVITVAASTTACIILSLVSILTHQEFLGIKYQLFAGIVSSVGFVAARVLMRQSLGSVKNRLIRFNNTKPQKRVLVIGAGNAGSLVIKDILKSYCDVYNIVGIIDDDKSKIGCTLCGIKVLGDRNKIVSVCAEKKIDLILFTIPSINGENKKELLDICHKTGAKVKVLPGVNDMILGKSMFKSLRDIDVTDLMPRDPVKLDDKAIKEYISNKVVLVTGGGGSIGSELCRQIAKFSPSHLIVLDVYENNVYDVEYELKTYYPDLKRSIIIASVRDRERIKEIFAKYKPQIVFHAAAHKHVPLMETNSGEAIKNNIFGTLNVAECADEFGAERFILISTDKAVNPTNVMGASKRICEMIIQAINEKSKTDFVAVRFGNVLGSNGSVIPLFKKQIAEGGPVTVTHKEITRFFMTIPEAAQLVLQAGTYAEGGEIFVLDMGSPVKIYDLAVNMIKLSGYTPDKDIEIKFSGLRPGEKLYEELLMSEEGLKSTKSSKIFIARPMHIDFEELKEKLFGLLDIAKDSDKDEISLKKAISEIVPTYKMYIKPEAKERQF